MTIDGTVSEILGYPAWFLINDARIPAKSAPTKAAAAGGNEARSTSSSRRKQADFVQQETKSFLDRVYRGSFGEMLTTMVKQEQLSEQDLKQLWQLLEDTEEKG